MEFIPEELLEVAAVGQLRNGVMIGIEIMKVAQGIETMVIKSGKMIDLMIGIESRMKGGIIVMIEMVIIIFGLYLFLFHYW